MDEGMSLVEMVAAQEAEVEQWVKRWVEGKDRDVGTMEVQIRDWALMMGCQVMARLVRGIAAREKSEASACPRCGGEVVSEGKRPVRMHTSMGDVGYERRYRGCRRCGHGFCPLDESVGLDAQHNSPAFQRMVSLAGAVAPFEKAGELLREIGSIPISAKKVEAVTEAIGARAEARMKERQQRAGMGLEKPAGPPPKRLYVEVDGTTVPMRCEGERAPDQRTPGKVEYKEVKLGAVFEATLDADGRPRSGPKTYTGTFGDAEACVSQVRAEAKARGAEVAEEIVLLNDGGTWIWNRLPEAFEGKKVTQILDCRHPQERFTEVAKRAFGEGTRQAAEWSEKQRAALLDGRVQEVIDSIDQLKPQGKENQEYVRGVLGYLRTNAHRMNYGELRTQGYFIGSGVIESACKHVVGDRFKRAGMKWSRDHVPKLLALRVCRASGWWDQFWRDSVRGAAA